MKRIVIPVAAVIIGACMNCSTEAVLDNRQTAAESPEEMRSGTLGDISDLTILFGHMSVGVNIMDGVRDLLGEEEPFRITEARSPEDITGPGFYHFLNGENGRPKTKIDSFAKWVREASRNTKIDIAFFKLCYVDIVKDTDVEELFDYYAVAMEDLARDMPETTFIHVTTPLYAHGYRLKSRIKNVLMGDRSNVKRNRYNDLMWNRYGGQEPVYRLDHLESLMPDGKMSGFRMGGRSYLSLAKIYTYDGGHLNRQGREQAAEGLLNLLVNRAADRKEEIRR